MKGKVFFSNGKVADAGSTGILNINGKKMKITLDKETVMKLIDKGIVDGCCFSLNKTDYNEDDINNIKKAGNDFDIDKMLDVFNEIESKSDEELKKELKEEEEARMKSIEKEIEIDKFNKMNPLQKEKYILTKVCDCIDDDKSEKTRYKMTIAGLANQMVGGDDASFMFELLLTKLANKSKVSAIALCVSLINEIIKRSKKEDSFNYNNEHCIDINGNFVVSTVDYKILPVIGRPMPEHITVFKSYADAAFCVKMIEPIIRKFVDPSFNARDIVK